MRINTPYPELNTVLREMVKGIQQILGDNFVGAYLQGSLAVGGFDEHSDVDFVIVTDQDLADTQVHRLQTLHKRIFNLDSEWAKHLEGSYFPTDVLREYNQSDGELRYLEHGKSELVKSNHCNTVVVRWILRNKGVVITGPGPSTLIEQIPVRVLRREIFTVIRDWGK